MTNNKLTDERMDDETLSELIEFRRDSAKYHAEQGHKHQAMLHDLVLNALLELQEYRNAEFMPKNLDRALTIMGVSLPESKEEFNLQAERWMQRLIDRVIRCESELNWALTDAEREELENYRNAQQVVPEWTNEQCLEFLSIAFRHAEIKGDLEMDDIRLGVKMVNACRADMLQGAEHVSNRDELPDGWVAVPVEPTAEMYDAGDRQLATKQVWDAMIAAAPQQEVK